MRGVIVAIVTAVILAVAVGIMTKTHAQQQNRESQATEIAVDENRIGTVEATQTRIGQRLDEQGAKLDSMRDSLASIQGMGTGAFVLITVIQMLGVGIQLKNRKPS